MKKVLVIFDGLADLPTKSLRDKTPCEVARTPNLDFFTENGKLGYMYPLDKKIIPGSDNALISIFGNNPKECKRGVYEAIGSGFSLKNNFLAFRINLGTIENLKTKKVIDRRAGRTLTTKEALELSKAINKNVNLPCKFEFKSTIQHRGVLVLKGKFSENITNIDTEYSKKKSDKLHFSKSLDNKPESIKTAYILNDFIYQAHNILNKHPVNTKRRRKGLYPANMIFTRGGGIKIPKINSYKNWMSINSMPLEIGIAKLSKMKNFSTSLPKLKTIDVYKNLYLSLHKNVKFAKKILKKQHKNFSGCYIHFKETDIPGHDNKPLEKVKMLQYIDHYFFGFLKKFAIENDWQIVVTCDHSTPCKLKNHSNHPVPVLVYNGKDKDDTKRLTERESRRGKLKEIFGKNFMKKTKLT